MWFDDVRFPVAISRGATGGPERRTEIVSTASGSEERNSRWAHSRRRYNIGLGVTSIAQLQEVIAFFEARRGRLHAFRFRDALDFSSAAAGRGLTATDQVIGEGDGVQRRFELVKTYGAPLRAYARRIHAPVISTLVVAVNGVVQANASFDAMAGDVVFDDGPPATGSVVTAGFEFDVPVRFDTDQITVNLAHFEAGEIPDIPLVEVRP